MGRSCDQWIPKRTSAFLKICRTSSLKAACADSFYYPQVPRGREGWNGVRARRYRLLRGEVTNSYNSPGSILMFLFLAKLVVSSTHVFFCQVWVWVNFFIAPNEWLRLKKYPQLVLQFMMHRNLWKHLIISGNQSKKLTKKKHDRNLNSMVWVWWSHWSLVEERDKSFSWLGVADVWCIVWRIVRFMSWYCMGVFRICIDTA